MTINGIKELLQHSDMSGSKSTILKPLTWFISLMIGGLIVLLKYNSPFWLTLMISITLGLSVIIFFFTYLFCLFTDKDAIRSEKYSIQKMAIERGIFGDNTNGTFSQSPIAPSDKFTELNASEEE